MSNNINKLFNNIGDNVLNNEHTSSKLVNAYNNLNLENKLLVKSYSIYTCLGVKNGAGIVSFLRGQKELSKLSEIRKKVVNKIILPIADLKHLVEVEEKEKTKTEKTKTKAENKRKLESGYLAEKSDENIKNSSMRTTANNIVFPILFLASQDKANYKFKDNAFMVNIKALDEKVVKNVFGINKKEIDSEGKYFLKTNLSLLIKLSKNVLFAVEVLRKIKTKTETENVEQSTGEITTGDFSEDKADTMLKSIISMLNYYDNNKAYSQLLKIENHIFTLKNYGLAKADITTPIGKQSKKYIDILGGCFAVECNNYVDLKANTFDELEEKFIKTFAIK
jgi:hypothetical protein